MAHKSDKSGKSSTASSANSASSVAAKPHTERLPRRAYEEELFRLQAELVKLQDWVVSQKLKVVVH